MEPGLSVQAFDLFEQLKMKTKETLFCEHVLLIYWTYSNAISIRSTLIPNEDRKERISLNITGKPLEQRQKKRLS